MMEKWPQGISLTTPSKVEAESRRLASRNILQRNLAEKMGFLSMTEPNESVREETYSAFMEKYGEILGSIFVEHQDFLNTYQKSLENGAEDNFDYAHILEMLPAHTPAHLNQ